VFVGGPVIIQILTCGLIGRSGKSMDLQIQSGIVVAFLGCIQMKVPAGACFDYIYLKALASDCLDCINLKVLAGDYIISKSPTVTV
jgi:hypothetical protein